MTWVLAVGFALMALAYALLGLSLSHWASVGALALIAILFVCAALAERLHHIQRDVIARRR